MLRAGDGHGRRRIRRRPDRADRFARLGLLGNALTSAGTCTGRRLCGRRPIVAAGQQLGEGRSNRAACRRERTSAHRARSPVLSVVTTRAQLTSGRCVRTSEEGNWTRCPYLAGASWNRHRQPIRSVSAAMGSRPEALDRPPAPRQPAYARLSQPDSDTEWSAWCTRTGRPFGSPAGPEPSPSSASVSAYSSASFSNVMQSLDGRVRCRVFPRHPHWQCGCRGGPGPGGSKCSQGDELQ